MAVAIVTERIYIFILWWIDLSILRRRCRDTAYPCRRDSRVFIFVLLSSQDGFATKWHVDSEGVSHAPALYNGAFSTIAFLIGAVTSIVSGWLGMTIATYANARTALEARKGIAPGLYGW